MIPNGAPYVQEDGATEGHPEDLQRELDRNVTVIDPEKAALEMEEDFVGARTQEDLERVSAARLRRRIEQKKECAMVAPGMEQYAA